MGLPWLFPLWKSLQEEADYFSSAEGEKEWKSRDELKAKEKEKLENRHKAAKDLMNVMKEDGGQQLYKEFDSIEKAWEFMDRLFPGRTCEFSFSPLYDFAIKGLRLRLSSPHQQRCEFEPLQSCHEHSRSLSKHSSRS